jgi:aminoglycoside phosphotransferase (APT) family kinase protein
VPEELTKECAGELFAELLPAHGPVRAVSRFAEGSVTGAYRVDFAGSDSAPVVLKIYEADTPWDAAKEVHVLAFLTDHGIDISPRPLAVSRAAGVLGGRACVVSSFRPGRTLSELDGELTSAQRHEVYRQLGEVLKRLHAIPAEGYGYVIREIRSPVSDNRAHMDRVFERRLREFRERAADPALADEIAAYVAERASAFGECLRPAYCHGDVHESNLLAQPARDGSCELTGLLDPLNMHAGDPLMDFARLDAFSMHGDPVKMAGLLSGYGVCAPADRPGEWPEAWRSRMPLYRVALAMELHNWFASIGETRHLPGLDRELRELLGVAATRD